MKLLRRVSLFMHCLKVMKRKLHSLSLVNQLQLLVGQLYLKFAWRSLHGLLRYFNYRTLLPQSPAPPCHCNIVLNFPPLFLLFFWATVMIFFVRVVLFLEHDPDTNLMLDSLNINFQCWTVSSLVIGVHFESESIA